MSGSMEWKHSGNTRELDKWTNACLSPKLLWRFLLPSAKAWLIPFSNLVPGSSEWIRVTDPERTATSCHSPRHPKGWAWTPLRLPLLPRPEAPAASEHGKHQIYLLRDQDPSVLTLLALCVPVLAGVPERHSQRQHVLGAYSDISDPLNQRLRSEREEFWKEWRSQRFLSTIPDSVLPQRSYLFSLCPVFLLCTNNHEGHNHEEQM